MIKTEAMKAMINTVSAGLFLVFSLVLFSCEEPDNEKEWGVAKVYMPQAAIQSGSTNNYQVPRGTNEFNKNYYIENNNITVVLGVYRSGLQPLETFTVDVGTRPDTLTQLINDGVLTNAILLPEDAYSLPASVSVADGEREAIFYLSIDRNVLLNAHPEAAGMRLALAVNIDNPSKYALNKSLSTTIVIVNDWETIE